MNTETTTYVEPKNKYVTAKLFVGLLAFLGWVYIIVGVSFLYIGIFGDHLAFDILLKQLPRDVVYERIGPFIAKVVFVAPGFVIFTSGLRLVSGMQLNMAQIDAANYARKSYLLKLNEH